GMGEGRVRGVPRAEVRVRLGGLSKRTITNGRRREAASAEPQAHRTEPAAQRVENHSEFLECHHAEQAGVAALAEDDRGGASAPCNLELGAADGALDLRPVGEVECLDTSGADSE